MNLNRLSRVYLKREAERVSEDGCAEDRVHDASPISSFGVMLLFSAIVTCSGPPRRISRDEHGLPLRDNDTLP
jgi:hypothetical protein